MTWWKDWNSSFYTFLLLPVYLLLSGIFSYLMLYLYSFFSDLVSFFFFFLSPFAQQGKKILGSESFTCLYHMKPSRQQYSLLSASAYGILLFKAEGKCGDPKTTLHEIKQLLKMILLLIILWLVVFFANKGRVSTRINHASIAQSFSLKNLF